MSHLPLQPEFQPRLVSVNVDASAVDAVATELEAKAMLGLNQCYGYFPAIHAEGIDSNLPASRTFAETHQEFAIDGIQVGFNFLRLSRTKQEGYALFHLDSDAATALTGELATVTERRVVRLLLNLNKYHPRMLAFLDVDPTSLPPSFHENYVYCPSEVVPHDAVRTVAIPPRVGRVAQGMLFIPQGFIIPGKMTSVDILSARTDVKIS